MRCNVCRAEIVIDEPYAVLNISADYTDAERFTGVAMHIACVPIEPEHVRDEADAFAHRHPRPVVR